MNDSNNFRSNLTSLTAFALFIQLITFEVGASTIEDIPGDVVRVNLSKHLFVHDMVSLSLVSKKLRQNILGKDNGRKTLRSALARLEIHVHNGEFNNNTLGYTEEQIAKRLKNLMAIRSDETLPDLIPPAGSAHYLWGVKVWIYKSIPAEHYALFANCKTICFARGVCLANDNLKYFANVATVSLTHRITKIPPLKGSERITEFINKTPTQNLDFITDAGIAHLKNVVYLNLAGHPVTYEGLSQLEKLKTVSGCEHAQREYYYFEEEYESFRNALKARGVRLIYIGGSGK